MSTPTQAAAAQADPAWQECRFASCSVLPVARACNLTCPFCFSRSSISAAARDGRGWPRASLARYYAAACERGATRLVVTGGGEPLLRPQAVLEAIREGRRFFHEIACFTNGTYLTRQLAVELADAGLSYLCWSRHHEDDAVCRALMGPGAPRLADFLAAAAPLPVRATCVMARGYVESGAGAQRYMDVMIKSGVRELTFKHTYVAHPRSLHAGSAQASWARAHRCAQDPFAGLGTVVGRLPWGPVIRQLGAARVCFYHEPDPNWELENRLCRSINLLSDGSVYASLEDHRSLLYRLT
jgi:cyclic pyranopterin phosphate synthase